MGRDAAADTLVELTLQRPHSQFVRQTQVLFATPPHPEIRIFTMMAVVVANDTGSDVKNDAVTFSQETVSEQLMLSDLRVEIHGEPQGSAATAGNADGANASSPGSGRTRFIVRRINHELLLI
jgi:hypothetical protein